MVRGYLAALPTPQFSNLKEVADHFAITDQDARFELLLDLLVDGLAARRARAALVAFLASPQRLRRG
jgi:hypothetical protein